MIRAFLLAALILLIASIAQAAPPASPYTFPEASAESVGLSGQALKDFDTAVQGYIDGDQAVCAELLVIKNRKTVLHTVHGQADRENNKPLALNAIFCVRSMTKPFVGTAIQMLIDEGKLSLSDHAAKYLPDFDTDTHRAITIEHLLTHTSGLPLSSLLKHDHRSLKSVQDVAGLAAKATLEFSPGERFSYSDDGTDTLTAIIEKITGRSADDFIQERILTPLGMADTIPVVKASDPRRARMIPLYGGSAGSWTKIWSPDQDALFPYFLGSQSLYSTCEDYARFLCFWADGGIVDGKRLLSEEAIGRALKPANPMGYPCGFGGRRADYAQLWMTWVDPSKTPLVRVAFGHGGSDGTAAWIWPEQDLIILYFTQSRGGLSSLSIEKEIDKAFFGAKPNAAQSFEPFLGLYWEVGENSMYRAIVERDGKLNIEIPGKLFAAIVPGSQPDHWNLEIDPTVEVAFERAADGTVSGYTVHAASNVVSRGVRRTLDSTLPTLEDVVAKVITAHGAGDQAAPMTIKRLGAIDMPTLKRHLAITQLVEGLRMRTELRMEDKLIQTTISDGDNAWSITPVPAKTEQLSGIAQEQNLLEHPARIFGDWRKYYQQVTVIGRTTVKDAPAIIVRCIPKLGYPGAMLVNQETGLVVGQNKTFVVPGIGVVGATTRYLDFRDVGGFKLPFTTETAFATPLLGKVTTTFDSAEAGVTMDAHAFSAPETSR